MKTIIWLGCLSYLLIGLAHVVIGSVLEELVSHYHVEYGDVGQLIFNQFAGFLIGVLTVPLVSRYLGQKGTLLAALLLLALGESVYSLLPSWTWMLVVGPVAGIGFGSVEAVIGALIIEHVQERKAVAMSRLEVFFGLGALLMPAVAGLLIDWSSWRFVFPLIAGLTVITAVLWGLSPLTVGGKEEGQTEEGKLAGSSASYGRPRVLLITMAVFFLLYVGLEMTLVNYVPSLFIESMQVSPAAAALSITMFWGAMAVGRMFAGIIAERIGYKRYLLASCGGTLIVLVLFALVQQAVVSFLLILLLGLMMAGIFAIGLVFANDRLAGSAVRITSLLVAFGGIGGALLPKGFGKAMDLFSAGATYWLLTTGALLLFVVLLVAVLLPQKANAAQAAKD